MDSISIAQHHLLPEGVQVKQIIETSDEDSREGEEIDPMEIATTVTIVEEDGSTSVVEGAQVSSVVSGGTPGASTIRFGGGGGQGHHGGTNGNVTYQIVTTDDVGVSSFQAPSGLQIVTASNGSTTSSSTVSGGGQYYVVSSGGVPARSQIRIDPRSFGSFPVGVIKSTARDDKKRATHNEVERRRRDKINGWIGKLARIVPACQDEANNKNQSKGGILAKACEYIGELKNANCRLADSLREHANTAEELDALRREVSELRKENQTLRQQLGPTEDDSTVIITTSE